MVTLGDNCVDQIITMQEDRLAAVEGHAGTCAWS